MIGLASSSKPIVSVIHPGKVHQENVLESVADGHEPQNQFRPDLACDGVGPGVEHEAANEQRRLSALRASGILDTEREPEFDQIVALAAAICGTPISSCTLVDETRQWFKATVGVDVRETGRELSLCSYAIQQPELMIVEDLTKDARFAQHPWVTGEPALRFYAGMPLPDPGGEMLGTLCIADTVPRQLTEDQKSALRVLTAQLQTRIELSIERRRLERILQEKELLLQALQANEHRFRTFMNNGPLLSFIRDEDGRFVFYNQKVAERFGVEPDRWIGKTLAELFPKEFAEAYRKSDSEAILAKSAVEVVEESQDETGRSTFWRSWKFSFLNERGKPMVGGMSIDVTSEVIRRNDLEHKNALLEEFALVDALTGLANRRAGEGRLRVAFDEAVANGSALSLILLDIDNFKARNDTFGHASGDLVLERFGAMLARMVRHTDVALRYGGEEFMIVLPNTDAKGAGVAAEKIRESILAAEWPDGPVTASFGVAVLDGSCSDLAMLVGRADRAMYQAKRAGKDRVVFASDFEGTGDTSGR